MKSFHLYLLSTFFCSLFLFSGSCFSVETPEKTIEYPEEIAARLQKRFDELQSLSFQFFQDVRGEMTGRPRQGSGNAFFYKEGNKTLMRWNYLSPEQQVIVSDGEEISMYFSSLQQMIVSPASSLEADITYSFFTGRGNLAQDFYIRPHDEDYQSEDENTFKVIKLIPRKPQSQVQDIHVWVTTDSLIRRLSLRDHFGTITVLNLSDIEANSLQGKTEEELSHIFSFSPPPDTEIIRQ